MGGFEEKGDEGKKGFKMREGVCKMISIVNMISEDLYNGYIIVCCLHSCCRIRCKHNL